MAKRTVINRPAATTWAVPLDDSHTMQIGFYRAPEARNRGAVPGSGRMRAGPTKTGSGSRAITMRKSASMAAFPGTVSNTSPPPTGA
jgi:hypothetical protein